MIKSIFVQVMTFCILFLLSGCAKPLGSGIPVDIESSTPGGMVTLQGKQLRLIGTPLKVGNPLPSTILIDAFSMNKVDLTQLNL